jgi:predicted anti-sigma-YlaC factor YlaD
MIMTRNDALPTACKDFEEDLVLFYYGDDSAADHRRVEAHLKECAPCRSFVEDLRKLLPQMAKPNELPPSFWDHYYDEMVEKLAVQQAQDSWWKNMFVPMRTWMLPAFGTAAMAALAIGLVISKGDWHPFSEPRVKIPQEILADTNQLEFFRSLDMIESLSSLESPDGSKVKPISDQQS